MEIGKYYDLEVAKEVDFGVYLNSEWGEILLPIKYVPENLQVGDTINVFVHRDSEDRILATTLKPKGQLDDILVLKVSHVNDHGAFMDWGLEKDLFVPKREQHVPFREGARYVVRICLDYKSDRLIGVGKINTFLQEADEEIKEGDEVALMIYSITDKGFMAVINNKYKGLIYRNEVFEDLRIGDEKEGVVKKVREDGKIDLSINKVGKVAIDENSETVLNILKIHGGFLPYHDKSSPEDIIENFNMSKKAFKKAIGSLYKSKLINIEDEGIRVIGSN